ncbi:hypothetical protein, partial [Xanthomonas oryzae]|uniref:hypothetical protein n=1 Tax=Xanthomonas oryzae TaxID=347 RepID=UPI001CA53FBB
AASDAKAGQGAGEPVVSGGASVNESRFSRFILVYAIVNNYFLFLQKFGVKVVRSLSLTSATTSILR